MLTRIRKSMDEKDEGFTLIELLVVIIIIGILAAIAIPVFLNQRKKGWDSAVKSDLRNAATSQETYLTDSGHYTNDTANLLAVGFKQSAAANYNAGSQTITYLLRDGANTTVSTTPPTTATGSYCMSAVSASSPTTIFKYDSNTGGIATGACA